VVGICVCVCGGGGGWGGGEDLAVRALKVFFVYEFMGVGCWGKKGRRFINQSSSQNSRQHHHHYIVALALYVSTDLESGALVEEGSESCLPRHDDVIHLMMMPFCVFQLEGRK
jgi:hypothetical protein